MTVHDFSSLTAVPPGHPADRSDHPASSTPGRPSVVNHSSQAPTEDPERHDILSTETGEWLNSQCTAVLNATRPFASLDQCEHINCRLFSFRNSLLALSHLGPSDPDVVVQKLRTAQRKFWELKDKIEEGDEARTPRSLKALYLADDLLISVGHRALINANPGDDRWSGMTKEQISDHVQSRLEERYKSAGRATSEGEGEKSSVKTFGLTVEQRNRWEEMCRRQGESTQGA